MNFKIFKRSIVFILIAAILMGCNDPSAADKKSGEKATLYILGAASLTDALNAVKKDYEQKHVNVLLKMTYASSGKLKQQIEQGAPADIFISAGASKVDELESEHLVSKRTPLLKNHLVLITAKGNASIKSIKGLDDKNIKKVAIGEPDTVPAGNYARQTLTAFHLWQPLQDQLVFAGNVRQVLAYVETGNADAGLVYETDAHISDKVEIIATAPESSHDPIVYPACIMKDSKEKQAAEDFYTYLKSEGAMKIFKKYGFSPSKSNES